MSRVIKQPLHVMHLSSQPGYYRSKTSHVYSSLISHRRTTFTSSAACSTKLSRSSTYGRHLLCCSVYAAAPVEVVFVVARFLGPRNIGFEALLLSRNERATHYKDSIGHLSSSQFKRYSRTAHPLLRKPSCSDLETRS
jgi:hypothetical protein